MFFFQQHETWSHTHFPGQYSSRISDRTGCRGGTNQVCNFTTDTSDTIIRQYHNIDFIQISTTRVWQEKLPQGCLPVFLLSIIKLSSCSFSQHFYTSNTGLSNSSEALKYIIQVKQSSKAKRNIQDLPGKLETDTKKSTCFY